MKIYFVSFINSAIIPAKVTGGLAVFDLYSVENVCIPAKSIKIIKIDTGFKIPRVYFRKIYVRSSFGVRYTDIGGSVINDDYRGPVAVLFFNFFEKAIEIRKGDRFCQIVFTKIANSPVLREVDDFEEDKIDIGEGSFGSTKKIEHVCSRIFANNYLPEYMPEDLPWFERDDLMTYIDYLKYEEFISDPDAAIKNTEIINIEMIQAQCRVTPYTHSDEFFQAVREKNVTEMQ